jgi:hypothetical protein
MTSGLQSASPPSRRSRTSSSAMPGTRRTTPRTTGCSTRRPCAASRGRPPSPTRTLCTSTRSTVKARTVLSWREADSDQPLYPDTYSPTARPTTFRMLCALAAQLGWTIRGCDLKQAYLQGIWPEHLKKVTAHMMHGYQKYHDGIEYVLRGGQFVLHTQPTHTPSTHRVHTEYKRRRQPTHNLHTQPTHTPSTCDVGNLHTTYTHNLEPTHTPSTCDVGNLHTTYTHNLDTH